MAELPLSNEAQVRRIKSYFPLSRGRAGVDNRRVLSGIVSVIRNGLIWRNAPPGYGLHKPLCNRFGR